MKILWIGISLEKNMKEEILKSGGKLMSGYVSQESLLEGLDALNTDMDSINAYPVGYNVFSNIEKKEWSRNGVSQDVSVGYKNIKYLDHFLREWELKKAAKKWAMANKNRTDVKVVVYSMHSPFIAAAIQVKKIIPTAEICVIVLDLPQYMDLAMNKIKKILKKMDWLYICRLMKRIDKYVLYAEPMASYLKLDANQWIVMEGSYNCVEGIEHKNNQGSDVISIMYSGVLDMRYGIPELLEATAILPENYEIWLTGNGNAVEMINEYAEKDSRIKMFGYLASREELLRKQAEATMLISPRRDLEEASKYCFPSKLFEYMVSGNPVLSCRLAGIPKEYFEYLIEIPSITAEDIAATIMQVAQMNQDARENLGEKGKRFILEHKNNVVQAKKIIDFVSGEIHEKESSIY